MKKMILVLPFIALGVAVVCGQPPEGQRFSADNDFSGKMMSAKTDASAVDVPALSESAKAADTEKVMQLKEIILKALKPPASRLDQAYRIEKLGASLDTAAGAGAFQKLARAEKAKLLKENPYFFDEEGSYNTHTKELTGSYAKETLIKYYMGQVRWDGSQWVLQPGFAAPEFSAPVAYNYGLYNDGAEIVGLDVFILAPAYDSDTVLILNLGYVDD